MSGSGMIPHQRPEFLETYEFDEDEGGEFEHECSAYWDGTSWHCPIAGSEECDFDCAGHPADMAA